MKKITLEWLEKAEGDYETMGRESRARKKPNYDAICFHAQQCAEKYLKARLAMAGADFPKTHDLVLLLDLVAPHEPVWETFRRDLAFLSEFSINYRYPGDSADKETALDASKMLKNFRKTAKKSFNF